MAEIASRYASFVILTNDNPRTEDPMFIMQDLLRGIPQEKSSNVVIEYDRELAIKKAYALSKAGSIIALLGKGPEEYQIFGEVKTPFYERLIVQAL
jgi:UDP-N-acetylmuramoyl-L-alanyl-D-glutamate--2,6-diaminopimelate ligase